MAKRDKEPEQLPDSIADEAEIEEPEGETLPTWENMLEEMRRERDYWRLGFALALLGVLVEGYFLYDAYNHRYDTPIYVYNQATASGVKAAPNAYQAEGYLSSIAQTVTLFNTWSAQSLPRVVKLLSDRLSPRITQAMLDAYEKSRDALIMDGYRQEFVVSKARWPVDKERGTVLKWRPGMTSFRVILEGTLTTERAGQRESHDVRYEVFARTEPPTLDRPHGFVITGIRELQ